ncbi:hypothetical protein [Paraburkholderia tropica]|uniref:hypothetical protein n=1 Tax=Paraburkholderia tropica TaxID=92647 RepID=UPI00160B8C1D|nr:hypothetical protein [Paraburkholderia tropica]MBB2981397.1 hypothetical protein [Paraburkholderia tropica]
MSHKENPGWGCISNGSIRAILHFQWRIPRAGCTSDGAGYPTSCTSNDTAEPACIFNGSPDRMLSWAIGHRLPSTVDEKSSEKVKEYDAVV